jgi:hypothetical protein
VSQGVFLKSFGFVAGLFEEIWDHGKSCASEATSGHYVQRYVPCPEHEIVMTKHRMCILGAANNIGVFIY